jgi:peptidoglycan/LPS O-acetylase OafA/YrhL
VTLTALVALLTETGRFSVGLPQYLANLTMVQSALGFEHVDGVYWTMEVQLVFYGWVFLICLAKQLHNAGKFLGVWLVASVFIDLFGGLTFTKLDYLLLPKLSFYFIAGGAFFLLYQRGRSLYLWSIIAVCYLMAIRLALADPRNGNPTAALVGNTLLFLLFARMVLHDHRLTGKPWMVTLFKMTYPLYLIHQHVGYVLLTKLDGLVPKYVLLVLVMAMMLLVSYGIAKQIDRWVMPPAKRAADRLLRLAGEPARPQARRTRPEVAASATSSVNGDRNGQAAMQPSAETVQ